MKSQREISSLHARINAVETAETARKVHINEVFAYNDKLSIEVVHVQRTDDTVSISGSLVNAGARDIRDLDLTVYCLDDHDRPFLAHTYRALLSDGKPIRQRTEEPFSIAVPCMRNNGDDYSLFVSDMDFL